MDTKNLSVSEIGGIFGNMTNYASRVIGRADRVLAAEARALGLPRSAFAGGAGSLRLPAEVACWLRDRAPNWAIAVASAGASPRLAKALRDAHRRAARC